jgi:hypothetical protein
VSRMGFDHPGGELGGHSQGQTKRTRWVVRMDCLQSPPEPGPLAQSMLSGQRWALGLAMNFLVSQP